MAFSPTRASPAGHGEAAGHLRNVLGALAVAATDLLTEDAQAGGYYPAEHAAIIMVGTVDGLSQEDLQRRLGLSQPGTTRLVDRLAVRGLLTRAPGPDRRTNALRLTPVGAREAEQVVPAGERVLGPLVAGLEEAEQQAAANLIGRMLATLVRSGRSPWRICRECDQAACDAGQCQCPVEAARRQLPDSDQPRPGSAGAG